MNFKRLLGLVVLVAGAAIVVFSLISRMQSRRNPNHRSIRPARDNNVLLVTLDTTRADHLGCYGGQAEVTPNLDRLAGQGVLFENVTATAPITLPSHASMLTGLYPLHHGVRNNGMFALPEELETLAGVFRDRGYATGAFVSAAVLASRYGLDRGFDVYDDDLSQGRSSGSHSVPERRGDITVAAAVEWLRAVPEDQPFFCWVHFYDPHAPHDPPPEFRRRFPGDPYSAEIALTDAFVGGLLNEVDQLGRLPKTLVSVVSDHGEGLGEHGEQTHAILLHQATLRVPWILAGPNLPRGERVDTPVSGADVAPTLAALVGVEEPNRAVSDGMSLVPLLENRGRDMMSREILSETLLPQFQYGWSPLFAIRIDNWELVSGRRKELFDLRRDPRELTDVADAKRLERDDLAKSLDVFIGEETTPSVTDARLEMSRSEIEKLQALGYLGTEVTQRSDPPDPRDLIGAHVHMERARNLASGGQEVEAIAELDRVLADDPGNVSSLTLRAQLLMQQDLFDEARADLRNCLSIDPENANAYAIMARMELVRARPQEALDLARIGAGKRGAFETLNVIQAQALLELGKQKDAIELLERRLQVRPNDPDLLAARARLYLREGLLEQAEEFLRRAVEADALHASSSFALASLLEEQGRALEATVVLEDFLSIDPGNPAALAALGRVRLDDPNRARAYLEEAVRLNPNRFEPLVSLGVCYLKLEMPNKAEASLRRALVLQPENIRCRNNLAIALFLQERPLEAEKELRAIIAQDENFAEAHNNLALVLHAQGKIVEAEQSAREALRLLPGLRDAILTLGTILHDQGRFREEVEVLAPLGGGEGADPQVAARYGVALEADGSCEEAGPYLEIAMGYEPNQPRLMMSAARCAEVAGDLGRAMELFERVAQIAPMGELRTKALGEIERLTRTLGVETGA